MKEDLKGKVLNLFMGLLGLIFCSVSFFPNEAEPLRYAGFLIGCALLYQVGKNLRKKKDNDFSVK